MNSAPTVYRHQKISSSSLLRYPGGKTRAIENILPYFPIGITQMCSPFFGGGSIEICLASRGVMIYGYDIFAPLVEFWQCTVQSPLTLARTVEQYYPLSKETFYALQASQGSLESVLERAAAFYVLNRSSFSGSTLSGGMSPGHPRFTLSAIQRLRDFYNPNIRVSCSDFSESITRHPDVFTYLDPPYCIDGALYGKKGDAHRNFDHERLRETLNGRRNWILSYNDSDFVRALYKGYRMVRPEWKYGMSSNKVSKEVLIFSHDITADRTATVRPS